MCDVFEGKSAIEWAALYHEEMGRVNKALEIEQRSSQGWQNEADVHAKNAKHHEVRANDATRDRDAWRNEAKRVQAQLNAELTYRMKSDEQVFGLKADVKHAEDVADKLRQDLDMAKSVANNNGKLVTDYNEQLVKLRNEVRMAQQSQEDWRGSCHDLQERLNLWRKIYDLIPGEAGVGEDTALWTIDEVKKLVRNDYMQDYLRMCDAHKAQRNRILRAIEILDGK